MLLVNSLPKSATSYLPAHIIRSLIEIEREIRTTWAEADRIWVGTRLLGGMSAGFGLRVLLPTKPRETTCLVLVGWAAALVVGRTITS